ncbi:unnamed protein product [Ambrosiozyma monospora]|uniref:Unnamed protein product n=1 Tax=Ambrosiozyma monospora TaxID=43982 RepID=A0A9W7DBU8_AMBMO|nr:unnamed protein product [Ambrosiozyma monospora]
MLVPISLIFYDRLPFESIIDFRNVEDIVAKDSHSRNIIKGGSLITHHERSTSRTQESIEGVTNAVDHFPLSGDFLSAVFGSKNIVIFYRRNYVGFRLTNVVISNENNSFDYRSKDNNNVKVIYGNDNNNNNNNNSNNNIAMNYLASHKLFTGYGFSKDGQSHRPSPMFVERITPPSLSPPLFAWFYCVEFQLSTSIPIPIPMLISLVAYFSSGGLDFRVSH